MLGDDLYAFPAIGDWFRETTASHGFKKRELIASMMMAHLAGLVAKEKMKPAEAAKWAVVMAEALLAVL